MPSARSAGEVSAKGSFCCSNQLSYSLQTRVTAASDSDTQGVAFASERSANDGHSVYCTIDYQTAPKNEIAPPAHRMQVGRFSKEQALRRFASPMDPLHTRHPVRAGR